MNHRIGTSGWSYDHWKGVFYPEGLSAARWFAHYAAHFDTVEINATFYRMMPDRTFEGWRDKAPPGFLYAVKMWRQITHRKMLNDAGGELTDFLKRATLLGDRLGPILIQLPPNLGLDLERLKRFLPLLSREFEYAVEFRHPSWFTEPIYELLRKHQAALCVFHHVKIECPRLLTAPLVYLRFHGASGRYAGKYTSEQLREWAGWARRCQSERHHVVAYFNNDYKGFAVENAREFRELVNGSQNATRHVVPTSVGVLNDQ
jgi:uncharacterized protein YecE (DUF72 family)